MPLKILLVFSLFLLSCRTTSRSGILDADIPTNPFQYKIPLGSGYSSRSQVFFEPCIRGRESWIETQASAVGASPDSNDYLEWIGFGFKNRAYYRSILSDDANIHDILNLLITEELSAVGLKQNVYEFGARYFEFDEIATHAQKNLNDGSWSKVCGDEYVQQIANGARFSVGIRLGFPSDKARAEFMKTHGLPLNLAVDIPKLQSIRVDQSEPGLIEIFAIQQGGNQLSFQTYWEGKDLNPAWFGGWGFARKTCSLQELDRCLTMYSRLLEYGMDKSPLGFPQQIKKDEQRKEEHALQLLTKPYITAGIVQDEDPEAIALQDLRNGLSGPAKDYLKSRSRLATLQKISQLYPPSVQPETLNQLQASIDQKKSALAQAEKSCFDETAERCKEALGNLQKVFETIKSP